MDTRLDLLKTTVALLYTVKTRDTMSPYYAKEGAETLLGIYISADDYQRAIEEIGVRRKNNTTWKDVYVMTPRFPMEWLDTKPVARPKGARTTMWQDYLTARATAEEVVGRILARDPHPDDLRVSRILRVIGHSV